MISLLSPPSGGGGVGVESFDLSSAAGAVTVSKGGGGAYADRGDLGGGPAGSGACDGRGLLATVSDDGFATLDAPGICPRLRGDAFD